VNPSIIRIHRGREYFGLARKLIVYLDDARSGEVRWNSHIDIPQKPGLHMLYVRMDWCLSPPLEIALDEGEVVELAVTTPAGAIRKLIAMYRSPLRFFELVRKGDSAKTIHPG